MIALKDGKPRVTKSGELEKVILKYINSKESRHSDMPMFRDK